MEYAFAHVACVGQRLLSVCIWISLSCRKGLELGLRLMPDEPEAYRDMRKQIVDLLEALQSRDSVRAFPLRDLRPKFKALRGLHVKQQLYTLICLLLVFCFNLCPTARTCLRVLTKDVMGNVTNSVFVVVVVGFLHRQCCPFSLHYVWWLYTYICACM